MNKEAHYMKKRQIEILQECLLRHSDKEDVRALKDLIKRLKVSNRPILYKSDLASRYGISQKTFNRRVMGCEKLTKELIEKFGYNKKRQFLMPGEVKLITDYLGSLFTKYN